MTTVPVLIAAIRDVIADVPGVKYVHYPAPRTITRRCEVVLYWGGEGRTTIDLGAGQHRKWNPVVKAQILTPAEGNTPAEFGEIDRLITPIVDAFDGETAGRLLAVPGLKIDRCQVVATDSPLMIPYAGLSCYGAELFFDIKTHRRINT